MPDDLNGSSALAIAHRKGKKVKTIMRNLVACSSLTYDDFRINDTHAFATLLLHAFRLLFLECYAKFNSIVM